MHASIPDLIRSSKAPKSRHGVSACHPASPGMSEEETGKWFRNNVSSEKAVGQLATECKMWIIKYSSNFLNKCKIWRKEKLRLCCDKCNASTRKSRISKECLKIYHWGLYNSKEKAYSLKLFLKMSITKYTLKYVEVNYQQWKKFTRWLTKMVTNV